MTGRNDIAYRRAVVTATDCQSIHIIGFELSCCCWLALMFITLHCINSLDCTNILPVDRMDITEL